MMGCGAAILVGLRSLVVIIAMAVIGGGAWALHTIRDAEAQGPSIVQSSGMDGEQMVMWLNFIDGVKDIENRIWVSVGSGGFTFIAVLYIFLSLKIDRLRASNYTLIPLEFFTMLVMAASFAFSLFSTLMLSPLCVGLNTSPAPELMTYEMLCPAVKGHTIVGGSGLFVLIITSISAIVGACQRARAKKACSFEPTASALGMGHGYQAVVPPEPRTSIPTLYDPLKPFPGSKEEEIGLATSGAPMDRRDSGLSAASVDVEKGISGPLGLEKPQPTQQTRPARPWSEAPWAVKR